MLHWQNFGPCQFEDDYCADANQNAAMENDTARRFMINLNYMLMRTGLSQGQLSRRAGISQSTISRYKTGRRTPKTTELVRMAEVLGCDASDLLAADPRDIPPPGEPLTGEEQSVLSIYRHAIRSGRITHDGFVALMMDLPGPGARVTGAAVPIRDVELDQQAEGQHQRPKPPRREPR